MVVPENLSPVFGKPHKGLQEAVHIAKDALETFLEREVETLAIAYSGGGKDSTATTILTLEFFAKKGYPRGPKALRSTSPARIGVGNRP
jgi:3'-phosphoadenosine 5'-phosphosulfate sulfotransferase (PAPS reductase)/FAD synthetase